MAKDFIIILFTVWFAAFLVNGIPEIVDGMIPIYAAVQSLGFSLAGLVLGAVTLLVKRESTARLRYAILVGVLGVAIPAFAKQIGGTEPQVKAAVKFQPEGCEFSVEFPAPPEINLKTVSGSSNLSFQEAKLVTSDDTGIRADCVSIDVQEAAKRAGGTEQLIAALARDVAQQSGLDPYQTTMFSTLPNGALVEGSKMVMGQRVTYQIKFFFGRQSIFTIYQGSKSSNFPTKSGIEFFETVYFEKNLKIS